MKKINKILILLLILLIFILVILIFKNEIFTFIWVKEYENKYKNINLIEKTLSFDTNQNAIEENTIEINGFKINLSDLNYNKNEKKLDFNLKFENEKELNNVGYILRVYNQDYCLGDRFNGYNSLYSAIEFYISYDKFYEENFGTQSKATDVYLNRIHPNNDLSSVCKMIKQDELLENGNLIHKISFELPEEFIITDSLKIELFDLNYQNIGNSTVYQVQEPLTQVKYTINFN